MGLNYKSWTFLQRVKGSAALWYRKATFEEVLKDYETDYPISLPGRTQIILPTLTKATYPMHRYSRSSISASVRDANALI